MALTSEVPKRRLQRIWLWPMVCCLNPSHSRRTLVAVYPDSPSATAEQCTAAQVAAITGALDFLTARPSLTPAAAFIESVNTQYEHLHRAFEEQCVTTPSLRPPFRPSPPTPPPRPPLKSGVYSVHALADASCAQVLGYEDGALLAGILDRGAHTNQGRDGSIPCRHGEAREDARPARRRHGRPERRGQDDPSNL